MLRLNGWIERQICSPRSRSQAQRPTWADESGSASLEFVTAGLLLLLPLVYLVLAMSAIQAGAFAVEGAARQAARVFVDSADTESATKQAQRAIAFAMADSGMTEVDPVVVVSCAPDPDDCLTRLGTVTVEVSMIATLPLTPPGLSFDAPVGVPLHASATQRVSRFWSDR